MAVQQLIGLTVAVIAACGFSTVDAFCRVYLRSNGYNGKCEPATGLFNSGLSGHIKHRVNFNTPPLRDGKDPPRLILISGCPGTGKSTFGMSLALEQGILKCISTDTVRAVMRSYVPSSISPPLHRSSYAVASEDGDDDPVKSWIETCNVLDSSVDSLVDDAIDRRVSLVLEGVSVRPSSKLIDKFKASGGTACGVLLMVSNEETHKNLLLKRGFMTGNSKNEEKKLRSFDRVRLIQDEMIKNAKEAGWILIEQRVDPDPLDVVADELFRSSSCEMRTDMIEKLEEDCSLEHLNPTGKKMSIDDLIRAVPSDLAANGNVTEVEENGHGRPFSSSWKDQAASP
mmetsp:Transcript_10754/g.25031  ORF Transcript_10754/g.25031 Transcript_10754/m.25031 type:complete len:342 (-) Transcript_10754:270-1295(-)